MQVDMHTHVLSLAEDVDWMVDHGREVSLCIYRSEGRVPSHRQPTEEEWEASGYSRSGWPVIGVEESLRAHEGFDKTVLLAVSPQVLEGRLIGTVDPGGFTTVPGPPSPEKCNDYIADLVAQRPDSFVGFASVNPNYQGVDAAVAELERSIEMLGLTGLKLYPMYQHWSPADRELAFPIFERAQELQIPVMVHQAGSTRIDASLEFARPALLDDVGRTFRDLRVIIAHVGFPWQDEALHLLTKHPNFYAELSYLIASISARDLFLFLSRCEPSFVPLEKIFFGSDYPGFLYDPVALREKLLTVNRESKALGSRPLSERQLSGLMGDNAAAAIDLG